MDKDIETVAATVRKLLQTIKSSPPKSKLSDVHMQALKILLRRYIDRYWADKLCVSKACYSAARKDGIRDIRKFEPRDSVGH